MFADLQLYIAERALDIEVFFKAVRRLRKHKALKAAKGLVFVELYAAYEQTVLGIVREAILHMKGNSMSFNTIRWELLALALHPEVTAVIDTRGDWNKRTGLFLKAGSRATLDVPDAAFPHDGSHFRVDQIKTIWSIFGITQKEVPKPPGRYYPLIIELVENRNAIAHGRRTALEVGARYSPRDIISKIRRTKRLCFYLLTTMQGHCAARANLCR